MTDMYSASAADFSRKRNYFEPGWDRLRTIDIPGRVKVLDLGCGNARLYNFLRQSWKSTGIDYTGVDQSADMLGIAEANVEQQKGDNLAFLHADLGQGSLGQLNLSLGSYHLVTMHALLHHISGKDNRQKLIDWVSSLVAPAGYLHISFWQFGEYDRYLDRVGHDPKLVGMTEQQMEKRDFIMDWRAGEKSYRFCHWADGAEVSAYKQQIISHGLQQVADYRRDGKEGDQNRYLLMQNVDDRS